MSSKFSLSTLFDRDHAAKAEQYLQKGQPQKAAEHYLKAGRPEQAAEVFAQLDDIDRAVEVLRQAGLDRRAAELLLERGEHRQAISLFEAAGAYLEAAEASLEAQQAVRAGRLFEHAGLYDRAAECFIQSGEIEHALGALELQSNQLKQQRAAGEGETSKQEIDELDLHRAELLIRIGHLAEAAELLAELGQHERAAGLFELARRFVEAARERLAAGRPEAALETLEQARDLEVETRRSVFRGAAELYLEQRRFAEAGGAFAEAGEHRRAGEAFARCRDHGAAADAFQAAGDWLRAGEQYLDAGDLATARRSFEEVGPKSPDYGAASLALISVLLKEGRPDAARDRLHELEERVGAESIPTIERLYWRGRISEELANYQQAEDCYEKVVATDSDFRDTSQRLQEIRGKIPALDTSSWTVVKPTTTRGLDPDDPHKTGPVALGGDGGGAGERPAPPAAATREDGADPAVTMTFTALPFQVEEKLEPWWRGTRLVRATELAGRKPALLMSLPQEGLGAWIESFRRIARDLIALAAPPILKLDDVILTDERLFLRYEVFDGEPLSRALIRERPLPLKALNLLAQVCDGLASAHKLGIAHRWLSPQTILIDAQARTKLTGFGLREVLAEHEPMTEAYLSPEAREGLTAGPPANLYAVGWLGLELLDAMLPAGRDEAARLDPDEVEWPRETEELVPRPIRELLVRCLSEDPAQRPSAEELRNGLASLGMVAGQMIDNRYEILGELGRGGMSRVYRARDRLLDVEVAIKTLLTPVGAQAEDKNRLLREAQISLRITHPNVVRVYDARELPNGIFIIMELLDGLGLDEIIRYEAPLPLPRAKKVLAEVTAALGEAHGLNVVHRDLKPGNIIVLASGRAKVMDFGIARSYEQSSQLTRAGEVVGSPLYMAPEQIQGLPLDGTCDLYALGVIAFTLLAGREPFLGANAQAVVLQHLNDPPPDVRDFNPELPQPWIDLLAKLLAKKPRDRFQSAEELASAIDRLPE